MSNAARSIHPFGPRRPEWHSERVGKPVTSAWSARARGDGLCRALTQDELDKTQDRRATREPRPVV